MKRRGKHFPKYENTQGGTVPDPPRRQDYTGNKISRDSKLVVSATVTKKVTCVTVTLEEPLSLHPSCWPRHAEAVSPPSPLFPDPRRRDLDLLCERPSGVPDPCLLSERHTPTAHTRTDNEQ